MVKRTGDRIVYSLNGEDIQNVASDLLERKLTRKEVELVENSICDYINWYDAIEFAIREHAPEYNKKKIRNKHF